MKNNNYDVQLRQLAAKYGFRPSKTYGQNFLIDEAVVEKIVRLSRATRTDMVVEIGPGFGVLTRALAAASGRVISFEIEKKLTKYWDEQLVKYSNLQIIWGNALKTFPEISKTLSDHYQVVANLPYQITAAVIRMFLEAPWPPARLTLMVQKEVGERICARPGAMSRLAVSVQYRFDPRFEFIVSASAFWPPPRVDSAVITLNHKNNVAPVSEDKWFFTVVKAGFSNRRKFLIKNLSGLVGNKKKPELSAIFDSLSLLPSVRAQELSVEAWQKLAREINPKSEV